MSALAARITAQPNAKFTFYGKQVKDPFGNHFADCRDRTAAQAICAALNAPIFYGSLKVEVVGKR